VSEAAVTCSHVSKSFGATRAVSDITFSIAPGEVLALVGENGAGKSTLMNMLSGGLEPSEGTITVAPPAGERARPVAMVHQELSLFSNLTISENLELDRESHRGIISERSSRETAQRVMRDFGVDIDVDATVGDLSVGQRQLVEVAKAIAVPPTLLILDEPTSSLEGPQVELLFGAIRRLSSAGTAVIFVSHRMEELFAVCDRVLVMRDGQQVEFGDLAGHSRQSLVESMVGREATAFYPDRPGADLAAAPVISMKAVGVEGRISDVSLDFPAGAITAIAGLDGHGQAEVAEVLAGARKPSTGAVRIDGEDVHLPSPRAAVRRGIGYIAPNRRLDGLLLDKSVAANMTLAAAPRIFQSGLLSHRRERAVVSDVVARLAVKCSSLFQPIIELSGGNQQKVLIGRWMIYDKLRVLVLNDPTRGVDVGSRAQIYTVIRELASRGVAVVLVSTDLQEILGLSDQIYVMYAGRVTGRLDSDEASESAVMHLATGGEHLV
jgi:ABC-type sugar transport system ATPase subunit